MTLCPHCHQPMPEQQRRDPPLPPLKVPAVVTIHDLTEEERARAVIEVQRAKHDDWTIRRLALDGSTT